MARDAILQFEIDRRRVANYPRSSSAPEGAPEWKWGMLARAALSDTLRNGGTFVVVVTDAKVTIIQRDTAEDLGAMP